MTDTQTLVETHGPDVAIVKLEEFDADFAQWILNNKDISKDERDAVRKLWKNRVRGNKHETSYKLGKDVKHEFVGRFVAVGGRGLQSLSRDCRSALAQKYYWDVDIRNAQPTILEQYANDRGWKCDKLKLYNAHRDDYIAELMAEKNATRDEAKEMVCRVLFGGTSDGMTSFFVRELQPEVNMLMRNIFNENQKEHPTIAKKLNATRSMMAYVLQTEEHKCLMALDLSLQRQGRSGLEVLIYDGGLVHKKDGETRLPDAVLRKAEDDIYENAGYKVSLAVKPLVTTFVRDDAEDDYAQHKEAFERTGWKRHIHFKIRFPPMFVAVSTENRPDGNPVEQLTKGELCQNEEDHKLADGEPFTKRWLEDPEKREYDRLVFEPGMKDTIHDYNLFQGLPLQPEEGDWSVFRTLLDLMVNHDPLGFEWVDNWVARRVQRLGEKSGVCIIVQGRKGVGKDTYWDQIGKIFGGNGAYFHNTSRPEHTVFARFNSQIAKCLLIKFEEADFIVNKTNEEQLKSLITSTDSQIEKKGHQIIQVHNYTDIVMTTNQEVPIPMSDDERRFAAFKMSEEKRGDKAFWDDIYARLADGKQLRAYYHHLLTKNIEGWSPTPAYKTRYYKDLVGVCAPYHARFFCDWVRMRGEEEEGWVEMGSSHDLMRQMTQKFPKFPWDNNKKFGIMMRDAYVEPGAIEKNRSGSGFVYRASPKALKEFLEERGWWDE